MSLIKLPKLVSFVLTFSYEPSRVFVVIPITLSNIFLVVLLFHQPFTYSGVKLIL